MDRIERYGGQIDIIDDRKLSVPIHLIGCGGIGSWTALMLAKMGCSDITIYDFDEVEDHNIASQFYKSSQLGYLKTECLVSNVYEQTDIELRVGDVKKEGDIDNGIVIVAIDTMKGRWKLEKMFRHKNLQIIDARMGGLQAEIYNCMSGNYKPTLVASAEAQHELCTAKAISFNCGLIASLIANYVRLICNETMDMELYKERTFLFDGLYMINPNLKPKEKAIENV